MAARDHRYWAFLSYSHADAKAAARLHRAIERYVLPRRLRAQHGLPRRFSPIFRDADELAAASSLTTRLQAALESSRWLIVLCSPAAVKSRYVDEEIRHFVAAHGSDRVLCALLEGEPAGSYPAAIKELPHEPLAADLRPASPARRGRLQLLAALAGIDLGILLDRDAARRRHRLTVAAIAAGMLLAAATWTWDREHRPFVAHYADFVRVQHVWRGIDPIAAEDLPGHERSYRFSWKGRGKPPGRVDYLDAAGRCPAEGIADLAGGRPLRSGKTPLRICTAEFEYAGDGSIAREFDALEIGDDYGIGVQSMRYEGLVTVYTGTTMNTTPASSRAHFRQFRLDADGRIARMILLSAPGAPVANVEGAYGYDFAYSTDGRVLSRTPLDFAAASAAMGLSAPAN